MEMRNRNICSRERELHFSVLSSWRNLTRPPALHALPPCFASAEVEVAKISVRFGFGLYQSVVDRVLFILGMKLSRS